MSDVEDTTPFCDRLPVTEEQCRTLAESLRILAQPQRLMILLLLRQQRCVVADIERLTGIAQPMLSQYLGQLRRAGLVVADRVGRQVFYMFAQTSAAHNAQAVLTILVPELSLESENMMEAEEWSSYGHGAMFARLL